MYRILRKMFSRRIIDPSGKKVLTVYLVHSLPLEMSVVQVFAGARMAAVAHLVDASTVGALSLLGVGRGGELEGKPWRAMLIKNAEGDWGVCAGAWLGMAAGVPAVPPSRGRRGRPGVPGKPGYFKMFYVNLRTGDGDSFVMPRGFTTVHGRKYEFSLPGLEVDLERGAILVRSTGEGKEGEMPELVALSFAASLLYLMVLPRPAALDDAEAERKKAALALTRGLRSGANKQAPMYLDAASLALLAHCGWRQRDHVPTNYTPRRRGGGGRGAYAGCTVGGGMVYLPLVDAGGAAGDFGGGGGDSGEVGDVGGGDAGDIGGCGGCGAGCGAG